MKRRDLIKFLEKNDCIFIRHGGNHDWYKNIESGVSQPIPRHRERLTKILQSRLLKN